MKILSVLASSNKKGNTATLLQEYLKGVEENHDYVEVRSVFLHEENIKPCSGCNACKTGQSTTCVIKDDMQKYYELIEKADVIIFATPVYWFNMTAQLKTFIDRIYAMDYTNFPKGKKLVLLTTFGASDKISSGSVNITNSLTSMTGFLDIDFIHDYGVSSSVLVEDNANELGEVRKLGNRI